METTWNRYNYSVYFIYLKFNLPIVLQQVMLSAVGALTAAFTWLPPPAKDRNGEIVAYQLEFNSPEWLAPRELTVADGLNYTLTGKSFIEPFTNLSPFAI